MRHIDPALTTALNALAVALPLGITLKQVESSTSVVVNPPSRILRVYVERGEVRLLGCDHNNRRNLTVGSYYAGRWSISSRYHGAADFKAINRMLPR